MEDQSRSAYPGAEEASFTTDNGRGSLPEQYGSEATPEGEGYGSFEGDEGGEGEGGEGERGIIGDTYRKLRGKPPKKPGEDANLGSFIFGKLHGAVQDISSEIGKRIDGRNEQTHVQAGAPWEAALHKSNSQRYSSFASPRTGNDIKWFLDGCGYFWAVSKALEEATHSIWILDCK